MGHLRKIRQAKPHFVESRISGARRRTRKLVRRARLNLLIPSRQTEYLLREFCPCGLPLACHMKRAAQLGSLIKNIKDMSEAASTLMKQREEYAEELDDIKDSLTSETSSQVIVRDVVFAGTKICINDIQMTVKSDCKYCRFYKDRADIKMSSL